MAAMLLRMQNCQAFKPMVQCSKDVPVPYQNDVGFPDHVYVHAAAIFQSCHMRKPEDQGLINYGKEANLWIPEARDEESCLLAHELAFSCLKYQELLESVLSCCLSISYSLPEDLMSLAVVLLFDFQQRKFVKRQQRSSEESLRDVTTAEACLFRFRIKLAASLARLRIKFNLVNIDYVLPAIVKEREKMASCLPLHGWVNTQKASLEDMRDALSSEGFSEVDSTQRLRGHAFCIDRHCGDLLVFSPDVKAELSETELVRDCKLVIQDKSCSLPPNAVRSVLAQEQCVLMSGSFSALTVAHTAAIAASRSGTVLVCESREAKRKELEDVLSKMECTNVDVIPINFVDLDPTGVKLENAAVVLMMPQCSLSAISNPVEFIVRENRDMDLLQDLSRGSISQGRLSNLVACQKQELAHAMKIPNSSAIVYSTCSSFSEENEEVVRRLMRSKTCTYRPSVTGLPSDSTDKEGDDEFFRLEASTESNGGFVAVMTKPQGPPTPQRRAPVIERPAERSEPEPKPTAVKSPSNGGRALGRKQQGKRKREKASQALASEPPPNRAGTKKNNSGRRPSETKISAR